jgi:NTP pyrophosphatase (non-canonical NTP hydrolase)
MTGMNTSLTLKQLTEQIMQQARQKGFGTQPHEIDVPEKMALIHSEVSEAFIAYRHKKLQGKDGFEEELGDIIQRVLHLCGALNIDVEAAILKKLESNKSRVWDWKNLNEVSHQEDVGSSTLD